MKVTIQILTMTLLAGLAAAQTAPASQTVQPNPQQPPPKASTTTTKAAAKSPFAPKLKAAQAAKQSSAKTAATTKASAQLKVNPRAQSPAPKANATPAATASAKKQVGAKPILHASAPKTTGTSTASAPTSTKPQVPAKPAMQASASKAKTATPSQTANAKKQAQPIPAKLAVKNASQPATPKPGSVQAKVEPKPASTAPAPEKKVEAAPVAQNEPINKLPSPGKRDPFLSPLAAAAARGAAANCTTGKRCLVVDQIVLKGIVQMKNGNLALVENGAKRPYVLHESDSLFNGTVVKITGDTMILREDGSDVLGRPVSKEVIKKVSAPAV